MKIMWAVLLCFLSLGWAQAGSFDSAEDAIDHGQDYLYNKQYEQGEEYFAVLLDEYPQDYRFYRWYVVSAALAERTEQATQKLSVALEAAYTGKLNPALARYGLAYLNFDAQNYEKSEAYLQPLLDAAGVGDGYLAGLLLYANLRFLQNDFAGAETALEKMHEVSGEIRIKNLSVNYMEARQAGMRTMTFTERLNYSAEEAAREQRRQCQDLLAGGRRLWNLIDAFRRLPKWQARMLDGPIDKAVDRAYKQDLIIVADYLLNNGEPKASPGIAEKLQSIVVTLPNSTKGVDILPLHRDYLLYIIDLAMAVSSRDKGALSSMRSALLGIKDAVADRDEEDKQFYGMLLAFAIKAHVRAREFEPAIGLIAELADVLEELGRSFDHVQLFLEAVRVAALAEKGPFAEALYKEAVGLMYKHELVRHQRRHFVSSEYNTRFKHVLTAILGIAILLMLSRAVMAFGSLYHLRSSHLGLRSAYLGKAVKGSGGDILMMVHVVCLALAMAYGLIFIGLLLSAGVTVITTGSLPSFLPQFVLYVCVGLAAVTVLLLGITWPRKVQHRLLKRLYWQSLISTGIRFARVNFIVACVLLAAVLIMLGLYWLLYWQFPQAYRVAYVFSGTVPQLYFWFSLFLLCIAVGYFKIGSTSAASIAGSVDERAKLRGLYEAYLVNADRHQQPDWLTERMAVELTKPLPQPKPSTASLAAIIAMVCLGGSILSLNTLPPPDPELPVFDPFDVCGQVPNPPDPKKEPPPPPLQRIERRQRGGGEGNGRVGLDVHVAPVPEAILERLQQTQAVGGLDSNGEPLPYYTGFPERPWEYPREDVGIADGQGTDVDANFETIEPEAQQEIPQRYRQRWNEED